MTITSLVVCLCLTAAPPADDRPCVITVVGAPGTPEYAGRFKEWAHLWQAAATKGNAESIRIGEDEDSSGTPANDRERLRTALAEHSQPSGGPIWLVLIGHGTFDGKKAKFNLRGPDVDSSELANWLATVKRTVAVIDCSSASGPFVNGLSGSNRVIVTATRSGDEQNYARFGGHIAAAIGDTRADLDKDGQVSLLEAFLTAANRVAESYKTDARLATEHPLIDDNGDKLGTPAEWFQGVRATKKARDGTTADGFRAHQLHLITGATDQALSAEARSERDRLELEVFALREQKSKLPPDEYYAKLEALMLKLAQLYQAKGK